MSNWLREYRGHIIVSARFDWHNASWHGALCIVLEIGPGSVCHESLQHAPHVDALLVYKPQTCVYRLHTSMNNAIWWTDIKQFAHCVAIHSLWQFAIKLNSQYNSVEPSLPLQTIIWPDCQNQYTFSIQYISTQRWVTQWGMPRQA